MADADGGLLINPAAKHLIGHPSEATLEATRRTSEFYRPRYGHPPWSTQDLPSRTSRGEEVDDAEMFLRPVTREREYRSTPTQAPSATRPGGFVAAWSSSET